MARGGPSLTALLGLLAVAGYQNRDKISDMLSRAQGARREDNSAPNTGNGFDFGSLFGAGGAGTLAGGLRDLVEGFTGSASKDKAESWVRQGDNQPVAGDDLNDALGEDTIAEISAKTGLSRTEILERLQRDLPKLVDSFTPKGRLPDAEEAAQYY